MALQRARRFGLIGGLAIVAQGCLLAVVNAQSGGPGASDEIPEIVVTAEKREQRLQDVGLSVTVETGEQLQTAGVADFSDLEKVVPGLNIGRSEFGYPVVSLRGVNLQSGALSAQPTVSTYVDEALLAYPAMTEGVLLDVSRVEVLKGPQGTLFGANVTGGAINIIANKPTSTPVADVRTEINNFGGIHLEGYVSGPLSSTLRARLALSTDQFGAWQKCYFGCDKKNGEADRGAARLLFDWTPTDALKVSLNLNGNYDQSEPQQSQFHSLTIQVPPGYPGLATYPLPPHNNRAADFSDLTPDHQHDRTFQTVLRADLRLTDEMTFTSLTNFVNTHRFINLDGDATVLPLSYNQTFGSVTSYNQEFRLAGHAPHPSVNYVVGTSVQSDHIEDGQSAQWFGYSGLPIGGDMVGVNPVQYRAVGVFANGDWDIAPKLTLTTGVRYNSLREQIGGCSFADGGSGIVSGIFGFVSSSFRAADGFAPAPAGDFGPGTCIVLDDRAVVRGTAAEYLPYAQEQRQEEHNISWKGGLNFKPTDDSLLYGTVSRGYKAGGFSPPFDNLATQLAPIKQEQLTSYELGAKAATLERRLVVEGAVFFYDYIDKQFLTREPGLLGDNLVTQNIPKSEGKGAEADVTFRPVRPLIFRGALTYLDTRVGEFVTDIGNGQFADIKGNSFNLAPKWSGTFDAEYRTPVAAASELYVGVSGTVKSHTFADLGDSPIYSIPAYETFDSRLGISTSGGWDAAVWVRNLADRTT